MLKRGFCALTRKQKQHKHAMLSRVYQCCWVAFLFVTNQNAAGLPRRAKGWAGSLESHHVISQKYRQHRHWDSRCDCLWPHFGRQADAVKSLSITFNAYDPCLWSWLCYTLLVLCWYPQGSCFIERSSRATMLQGNGLSAIQVVNICENATGLKNVNHC